jgi:hypothetical protein
VATRRGGDLGTIVNMSAREPASLQQARGETAGHSGAGAMPARTPPAPWERSRNQRRAGPPADSHTATPLLRLGSAGRAIAVHPRARASSRLRDASWLLPHSAQPDAPQARFEGARATAAKGWRPASARARLAHDLRTSGLPGCTGSLRNANGNAREVYGNGGIAGEARERPADALRVARAARPSLGLLPPAQCRQLCRRIPRSATRAGRRPICLLRFTQ